MTFISLKVLILLETNWIKNKIISLQIMESSLRATFVTTSDETNPDYKDTCHLTKTIPTTSTAMMRYFPDQQIVATPLSVTLGK